MPYAGTYAFTIVVDDREADRVKATLAVSYIADSFPEVTPAFLEALK